MACVRGVLRVQRTVVPLLCIHIFLNTSAKLFWMSVDNFCHEHFSSYIRMKTVYA